MNMNFWRFFIIAPGMLTAALCAGAVELGFDTASCSSAGRSLPCSLYKPETKIPRGIFCIRNSSAFAAGDAWGCFRRAQLSPCKLGLALP